MAIDQRSLRIPREGPPAKPGPKVSPELRAAKNGHDPGADHEAHTEHDCELCAQIESGLAVVDVAPVDVAPVDTTAAEPADAAEPAVTAPTADSVTVAPVRRRRVMVIAIVAVFAVAVFASIAVISRIEHPTKTTRSLPQVPAVAAAASPSASPTPDQLASAMLDWARQQLPPSAVLLTDPATQTALVGAGFTQAVAPTAGAAPVPTFGYVVETPALQAAATANAELGGALAAAVPVAVFGTGTGAVTVRQAVADSATVVAARQAADATTRQLAERQLLANPAVHATGSAATSLSGGQLDLRAATVLVYLANSTTVTFTAANVIAPEQQAGLPVRSIDISIGAPAVMQTIVSGLPIAYQPATVTQLSSGAVRMVWPISAEPMPGLS